VRSPFSRAADDASWHRTGPVPAVPPAFRKKPDESKRHAPCSARNRLGPAEWCSTQFPDKDSKSNKGYANGTERVARHARRKVGCANSRLQERPALGDVDTGATRVELVNIMGPLNSSQSGVPPVPSVTTSEGIRGVVRDLALEHRGAALQICSQYARNPFLRFLPTFATQILPGWRSQTSPQINRGASCVDAHVCPRRGVTTNTVSSGGNAHHERHRSHRARCGLRGACRA